MIQDIYYTDLPCGNTLDFIERGIFVMNGVSFKFQEDEHPIKNLRLNLKKK